MVAFAKLLLLCVSGGFQIVKKWHVTKKKRYDLNIAYRRLISVRYRLMTHYNNQAPIALNFQTVLISNLKGISFFVGGAINCDKIVALLRAVCYSWLLCLPLCTAAVSMLLRFSSNESAIM